MRVNLPTSAQFRDRVEKLITNSPGFTEEGMNTYSAFFHVMSREILIVQFIAVQMSKQCPDCYEAINFLLLTELLKEEKTEVPEWLKKLEEL